MKKWQRTVVTLAALIYLDNHLLPWATFYIRHAGDMGNLGRALFDQYGFVEGLKQYSKLVMDACEREEES